MERFHPTKLKFSGDPGGASLLQLATIPAESIPLILSLLPPWTVTLETPTLTLNLERQGVWKSCRTQGGKNAGNSMAFVFQWHGCRVTLEAMELGVPVMESSANPVK